MASIILSSAGSTIGNAILPGIGGRIMRSAGSKFGSSIDRKIGWSSPLKDGPRLENFEVQDSRYGITIPMVFGRSRVAGNVIWASDIIETIHKDSFMGGKGGVVSSAFSSPSRTTYSYSINCAVAICMGEIGKIETIWADSSIIYKNGVWSDGVIASCSIYNGGKDQSVDPLLESWIGETPAYKNIAYIVLEGLELSNFGNRLPNLTFEVSPLQNASKPKWSGDINPDLNMNIPSNKLGGLSPISLGGVSSHMIIGSYKTQSNNTSFEVSGYDVSGDKADMHYSISSNDFTVNSVFDHSWDMSPDNRYVAIFVQDDTASNNMHLMLYDSFTRSFGNILTVVMNKVEQKQIMWIDAHHFIVTDVFGDKRGVRVFTRSGSDIVDMGFYDVWGSGSSSTHYPVAYTQFRKYGSGVMHYMGNNASNFSEFYCVYLSWIQNELVVGNKFNVGNSHSFGAGANAQIYLLPKGNQEWILLYLNALNMQMMSFIPSQTGITVTREWQKIYSNVWFITACNVPVVYGNDIYILHITNVEASYRLSKITLGDNSFNLVDDAILIDDYNSAADNFGVFPIDSNRIMVIENSGLYDEIANIGTLKLKETSDSLENIVSKLFEKAGYNKSDYDVSSLLDVLVDGYVISKQLDISSALQPLQFMNDFEIVERDGKLIAQKYDDGFLHDISDDDLCAKKDNSKNINVDLTQSRIPESMLPIEMSVNYLDASRNYEIGSQRSKRIASNGSMEIASLNLPVVCTASFAKKLSQKLLYKLWTQRDLYNLSLAKEWLKIDVGDKLNVKGNVIHVTSLEYIDGVVEVGGVSSAPLYFEDLEAENGNNFNDKLSFVVESHLYMMDLPLLFEKDDRAGFYVSVGSLDGFKGASVWRSQDGVDFKRQFNVSSSAVTGSVVNILSEKSCHYKDIESELYVQLISGSLSSCLESDLLNGANVALCGNEIIQFQNATLIGDGYYKLSNLLRGRRGTEKYIDQHKIGERFILLQDSSLQFIPVTLSDRNKSYHYRAVANGGSIEYAQDITYSPKIETLKPFAPCHLKIKRVNGVGSDVNISWVRCARKNADWVDYIDVPLDEDNELYDVEIMDNDNVVRSFTNISDLSVLYSASDQSDDWGSVIPSNYTIKIYQISSRYGRGEPAIITA